MRDRSHKIALVLALLAAGASAETSALPDSATAMPGQTLAAPDTSLRPVPRKWQVPSARWGTARLDWTVAALGALRSHARPLTQTVPADIADWCPAYAGAGPAQRAAFWVGLTSALAWHESTHRPGAVGGGGRWYGLTQIYPPTARHFGCTARSGAALKDPRANLSCALRIMAVTVPRDGVVSRGMRGVAADWGPFHSARKREDMRAWVRSQSYCAAPAASLRPVARRSPQGD